MRGVWTAEWIVKLAATKRFTNGECIRNPLPLESGWQGLGFRVGWSGGGWCCHFVCAASRKMNSKLELTQLHPNRIQTGIQQRTLPQRPREFAVVYQYSMLTMPC